MKNLKLKKIILAITVGALASSFSAYAMEDNDIKENLNTLYETLVRRWNSTIHN